MPQVIEQAIERIEALPPYAIIGIIVVVVVALFSLGLFLKRPKATLTAFSSETGSVLISRKALQDLIRQACLKDERVEAARPVIKISGPKINTSVTLRLSKPDNLKETSERLQTRISKLLQKSLNFEQIGPIEIMVTSFGKNDVDEPNAEEVQSILEPLSLNPQPKEEDSTTITPKKD